MRLLAVRGEEEPLMPDPNDPTPARGLEDRDRDARRSGGYGTAPTAATGGRSRVERAFATLREMLEAACSEERPRRIALRSAGLTDLEIAATEGVDVRCVKDTMRHATACLAYAFPDAAPVLKHLPASDLLRAHRNRADHQTRACWDCGSEEGAGEDRRCLECGAEWGELEQGESEQTAIRGRPFGAAAADLRLPRDLSPGDVARRWHAVICRIRQVAMPERALARLSEAPTVGRPGRAEERRKTRRERRAERRQQAPQE
jgi:hypothetical protein